MVFPIPGDEVTVHLGGDCGITLKGTVRERFARRGREGMVITNPSGKKVTLFFEELDDWRVQGVGEPA